MEEFISHIIIAPILYDNTTLIIYRNNGEEIKLKLNKEEKTIDSRVKLTEQELLFIKENYL